ncbi:MAG: hypothetical protein EA355_14690 [Rhodobacteraceae bacterium]|nr:MAG: hypothetical protein EA355_14690 [Paracoccaceae bacterium]
MGRHATTERPMHPTLRRSLPLSLWPDARDAALPADPPEGFRNILGAGAAPDCARWRGVGSMLETERMLEALAFRLIRGPAREGGAGFPAGYAYFAQFVTHDLHFSTDPEFYPRRDVPHVPWRRRRLRLDSIYGEGPEDAPYLYGEGVGQLADWRLRIGRFGPGPIPRLTVRPRAGCPADPRAPQCGVDERNDENPVVAQLAGLFMRLHNRALDRLTAYGDPAERFAAARAVTEATFRRLVFDDLLPRLLRPDVRARYEREGALDEPFAAQTDDMPVEFTHAVSRVGHALVRADYAVGRTVNDGHAVNVAYMLRHTVKRDPEAFRKGRLWRVDWPAFFGPEAQAADPFEPHVSVFFAEAPGLMPGDAAARTRAHLVLRDLARGMEGGVQTVTATAAGFARRLGREAGSARWLALNPLRRAGAMARWIGADARLAPWRRALALDPPLYLFTLVEAAAPAAAGGGDALRLGALGSALFAEPLYAARALNGDAAAAARSDADGTVVFDGAPPRTMDALAALFSPASSGG